MKFFKYFTVSFLFLTLPTFGCQNECIPQDCSGDNAQSIETFYSEEFAGAPCGLQNIDNDKKEVNLILTTQTDFDKYFNCAAQLPVIDFDNYFILAGMYRHHQCAVFDSQSVSVCNNKIKYSVTMLEQDCQAITSVFYATVIEKEYNNLPIDFDVQFKN